MEQTEATNGGSRLDRIEAMLDRHAVMIVDQEMRHHTAISRIEDLIEQGEERHHAAVARIEDLMGRQVLANEEAHDEFRAGFKSLLGSQVVMNAAIQDMAAGMKKLEVKMEETTDKLNGLIATVDGFIRRPPATP